MRRLEDSQEQWDRTREMQFLNLQLVQREAITVTSANQSSHLPLPVLECHRSELELFPSHALRGGQSCLPSSIAEFTNPGSTGQGCPPSHSTSNLLTVRYRVPIKTVIVVDGVGTANLHLSGIQRNGFLSLRGEKQKRTNTFLTTTIPIHNRKSWLINLGLNISQTERGKPMHSTWVVISKEHGGRWENGKRGREESRRGCSLDPLISEHHFLALLVVVYNDFINRQMACESYKE